MEGLLLDFSEPSQPAKPKVVKQVSDCSNSRIETRVNEVKQMPSSPGADEEPIEKSEADSALKDLQSVETSGNEKCELLLQSMADVSIEEARADNPSPYAGTINWDEVTPLEEEVFDFDLPGTPSSGKTSHSEDIELSVREEDEDDEIFFGPVGFMENVVSKAVELEEEEEKTCKPLEPLSAEEMVHLFKEAQTVAFYISKASSEKPKKSREKRQLLPTVVIDEVPGVASSENQGPVTRSGTETRTPKASGSVKTKPKGCVRLNLSPLENMAESLDKVLPKAKLPVDSEGVFRFSAKGKISPVEDPKKSETSRLRGKGLQRPTNLKMPGRKSEMTGLVSKGMLCPSATKENMSRKISPQKRRKIGMNSSMDDETSSIASDISDTSSTCSSISGKRKLLEPGRKSCLPSLGLRLVPPDTSRGRTNSGSRLVPPSGHTRTLSNSSTGSTSSQRSTSPLPEAKKVPFGLRPPGKCSAKPGGIPASSQLQKPAIKGAMTRLELLKPGNMQRKTLTVNRSKLAQAGLGPLKAVGPVKSLDTTDSEQKPQPLKSGSNKTGTPRKNKSVGKNNSNAVLEGTPKKELKNVQPKRILNDVTPRRSKSDNGICPATPTSMSKSSQKRRSFLPTPKKKKVPTATLR